MKRKRRGGIRVVIWRRFLPESWENHGSFMVLRPSRVTFGEFALDPDLRQLRGPAGELRLSTKAFDLLVLLVTNRTRILSKIELQERLWPDTFVDETNLPS